MYVPDTDRLGAHVTPDGVAFALWAPRAEGVDLVLIDSLNNQSRHPMTRDLDGIWSVDVAGIGEGQHYGFRVAGPWAPHEGLRFNPNRLLLDPYARAVVGGIDFHGPILDHTPGNVESMSTEDSVGAVPVGVVVADSAPPVPVARRRPMAETVIYEAHLRGFTKLHPDVPEHLRGSYLGFAEPAVIEHLVELGITAVEFLPLQHFVSEPFIAEKGMRNYWGYNTIGFFAPQAAYAPRGTVGSQVDDFKQMVSALHRAGIEVILDVVYNHTGEAGIEGPTLSMRGIDSIAYYRLTNDLRDDYDVTGCGNSVDTSNPMVLQLVLDSLRYWVTEMGVDGFRFDLATTLIRDAQHHVDHSHGFKEAIAADPVFDGIKMIAEPWDVGPYGYQVGAWGPGWSEWNDRFRDHVRDYWRGSVHGVQELATRLAGSPDLFDSPGRTPQASINFVTAHDGFTLRDLVSYDVKHNLANGESNRDGSDNNHSWNHGWEGETADPEIRSLRRRQVLNMMATQVLALGTPMLTAGDEFGRTQRGNNNAYCQDSRLSWVDWSIEPEWRDVQQKIRDLLALRRDHVVLRPEEFAYHTEVLGPNGGNLQRVDLTWMDGVGGQMGHDAWHDGSRRLLGMYVSNETEAFLTWFSSSPDPAVVKLPGLPWGYGFEVVWHTATDYEVVTGVRMPAAAPFLMPPRAVVMMRVDVHTTVEELMELKHKERSAGRSPRG